jgi:hypothetical protein
LFILFAGNMVLADLEEGVGGGDKFVDQVLLHAH